MSGVQIGPGATLFTRIPFSANSCAKPAAHNYIYFVADGSGGHVFAETLEQHNKNVAKWRQIRRERDEKNEKKPN